MSCKAHEMFGQELDEVLKKAKPVLDDTCLCSRCLGRLFGKLGHGYTNLERGIALREGLGRHVNEPEQESDCWVCEGIFLELEKFSELAKTELAKVEYNTFLIGVRVDEGIKAREEALWARVGADHAEPIKTELNREIGKPVGMWADRSVDFNAPEVTVIIDTQYDIAELQISPLFLYGRYQKLIRGIPQTVWPCRECRGKGCDRCDDTGKMYQTSVQELIQEKVLEAAHGEEGFFHGMGREDVDVLMLGRGRPFILEVKRPKKRLFDLEILEKGINEHCSEKVRITDLRPSDRAEVVAIKEAKPAKTYRLTLEIEPALAGEKLKKAVSTLAGATLSQRTPKRVSHRRADKIRKRKILDIVCDSVEGNEVILNITAESGTYIKEMVTGDGGRTVPNLAESLGEVNIISLDVLDIMDQIRG